MFSGSRRSRGRASERTSERESTVKAQTDVTIPSGRRTLVQKSALVTLFVRPSEWVNRKYTSLREMNGRLIATTEAPTPSVASSYRKGRAAPRHPSIRISDYLRRRALNKSRILLSMKSSSIMNPPPSSRGEEGRREGRKEGYDNSAPSLSLYLSLSVGGGVERCGQRCCAPPHNKEAVRGGQRAVIRRRFSHPFLFRAVSHKS